MTKFEKRIKEMYATGDIHSRFEVVLHDGMMTILVITPIEAYGTSIMVSMNWLDNKPHYLSDVKSWRELD